MSVLTAVICLVAVACTSGAEDHTTTSSEHDTSVPPSPATQPADGTAEDPGDVTTSVSGASPTAASPTGLACWSAPPADGDILAWSDQTAAVGLVDPLTGMHGHAAAWGDFDGDQRVDLVVGTFADRRAEVYAVRGADGPSPDRLLFGGDGGFELSTGFPDQFGRASGAAAVDLDLDGDLDLVVSRNVSDPGQAPTAVYANDGGRFELAGQTIDPSVAGRSVAVLHIDGDALPDLVVLEDRYRGRSARALRNLGELRFEDAGAEWGWPSDVHGLGVATGDLNRDGWTDLVVAGSNRIFVGTGTGLREVDASAIAWEPFGDEDDVAGAALADVNNDGRLDLVLGHHFNSALGRGGPEPVRLFLNDTDDGADPAFREVTDTAGLTPIPTKAPHVELADVNNDGYVDVVTSASAGDGTLPAVFLSTGLEDGVPRFSTPAGLGHPQYWVSAPTADYDRDGRLDLLAVEWEPTLPSLLFRNESASGGWLEVSLDASFGAGVGTRVEVFDAGSGDRVGTREITAAEGYAAGSLLVAHIGLGAVATVDVVLTAPGREAVTVSGIAANQHVRLPGGCG